VATATLIQAIQQAGYDASEPAYTAAEAERDAAEQATLSTGCAQHSAAGILAGAIDDRGNAGWLPALATGQGFWIAIGLLIWPSWSTAADTFFTGAWRNSATITPT